MSLILDALRRADSERERDRGAVPGLHAQQVAVAAEAPPAAGVPSWLWLAIIAGAGLAAALGAWVVAGHNAPHPVAAPAVSATPAAAQASAPPPAATAVIAPASPAAAKRPEASTPQPVAEPAPWPAREAVRKEPTTAVASAAAPIAGSAPVEAAITPREQLPESVRAQLPALAVGGSIYSANAPDRSIIIDGRLWRENDRLAADLTLEQIRPKSAVLRFRGHRFEIRF